MYFYLCPKLSKTKKSKQTKEDEEKKKKSPQLIFWKIHIAQNTAS